jgi:uncharacterized protein (TIGR02271 family)
MSASKPVTVTDSNGLRGTVAWTSPQVDDGKEQALIHFENGERVSVPKDLLVAQRDGTYRLPISLEELRQKQMQGEELVIPILEERLKVEKHATTTATIQINKRIQERVEEVSAPLAVEEVEVERVAINRPIDEAVLPRYEGDTLVIPLVEEVLVVEKRLMLREEVHIRKLRTETHTPQQVTLRREDVEIRRNLSTPEDANPS